MAITALFALLPTMAVAQDQFEMFEAFGLEQAQFVTLNIDRTSEQRVTAEIMIEGVNYMLDLRPHSIRTDDFLLKVQLEDGSLVDAKAAPPKTVRGTLIGSEGSRVVGSVLENGVNAKLSMGDGRVYFVEPVISKFPNLEPATHVIYQSSDVKPHDGRCGVASIENANPQPLTINNETGATNRDVNDLRTQTQTNSELTTEPQAGGAPQSLIFTEIGVDADFEFFQDYGSVAATVDRMELVINTMNDQFENDVDITHIISAAIVRTTSANPYTSFDQNVLLNQFRDEWNVNQSLIRRDVAQLFTGKEIIGTTVGLAWVGVVCDSGPDSLAYSWVQSDYNGNFGCATDLNAHELGHNWNASHCDCDSPARTMNPNITCSNDFNNALTVPTIVGFRNSLDCLTNSDPDLRVFDNGVTAFTNTTSETSDDDNARILAEDAIFDTTTTISKVEWSGQYSGGTAPATDDFLIEIYADSGGLPTGSPLAVFNVGNNVNRTLVIGSGEFDYSAAINFTMPAGVRHWVCIHDQDTDNNMDFRWNATTDNGNAGVSFDGGASWNADNENFDMSLFVSPVFDNGLSASTNTGSGASDLADPFIRAARFSVGSNTTITRVHWSGQYGGSGPPPVFDNFRIQIFPDDAGVPGNVPVASFVVGNDVDRNQVVGTGEFVYLADIHFGAEAGVTYWMSIHDQNSGEPDFGWNSAVGSGTSAFSSNAGASWTGESRLYDLALYGTTPPPNDFYFGTQLTLPFNQTATNAGASIQSGEQQTENTGSTVWSFFFAPDDGTVTLDTFGSSFDTQLHVYTGFDLGFPNLIPVANNNNSGSLQSQVSFPVEAGECYDIRVGGFRSSANQAGAEGNIVLNGSFEPFPDPPFNDDWNAPGSQIPNLNFSVTGTNVAATTQVGEQQLEFTEGTVWWFIEPEANGIMTIDTFSSDTELNTQLHIYESADLFEDLIPVVDNDDAGIGLSSEVTFKVTAGVRYDIRVGSSLNDPANTEGMIGLNGSFEEVEVLFGDVNLDGVANLLDVAPFIDRISNGVFQVEADTNMDGSVNLLDVVSFVDILSGG